MGARGTVWPLLAVAAVCGLAGYYAAARSAGAHVVTVAASKFAFSAPEIRVKKGESVTLVLTTPDFAHGLSIPDFNIRADLVPGKQVELTFTPDRAGRFVILCDNFCGDGHDDMTGILVVTEE